MNRKTIFRFLLVGLILVFVFGGTALAAKYPKKPITMIIPFGAGGSHDLNARIFTSVIPQYLGQAVVVKLMPGAGGQTATAAAARAKPDGYTLIFTHNYVDQLQPLIEELPYDTMQSFKTVWVLNYGPPIIFCRSDKPWKTLKEVLDYGRKHPGKLHYNHTGKWGAGFVPGALILTEAGVQAKFIPYKGGGPALRATLAGDGDFAPGFPAQLLPHYKTGKIRCLAIGSAKRHKEMPDVPTLKELGYSSGVMYRVVMAPRKTKEDRIKILRDAFRKLYDDKTFKNLMAKLGENMEYMDGPDYEKVRVEQNKQYTELIEKITGEKPKGK